MSLEKKKDGRGGGRTKEGMKQGRKTRREEGECIKKEEGRRKEEGKKIEEERLNVTLIICD